MDCFNCKFPDCIRHETQDENERKKEWNRKNPEKLRAIRRRYYERHREQEKAYQKAYYEKMKNDPEYRARKLQRQREYKARKKAERQYCNEYYYKVSYQ